MLMKLMPTLAIRKIPAAVRVKIRSQRTPLVSASITVVPLISFEGPLLGRVETGCRRVLVVVSVDRPRRLGITNSEPVAFAAPHPSPADMLHSAKVLSSTHRHP